jgi:cytochrome c-type biogenesis protein
MITTISFARIGHRQSSQYEALRFRFCEGDYCKTGNFPSAAPVEIDLTLNSGAIGYLAAFGAGLASFASPCILPLVPTYISVIATLGVGRASDPQADEKSNMRALVNTALFVGGFTVVFVLLGVTASGIGQVLVRNQTVVTRISGVFMVAVALYLAGTLILRTPALYGEYRFHPRLARFGPFAAPVAGAAFAFGWTPCVGPVLAAVLTLAARQSHVWQGGTLLLAYSAGLGLPFLLAGVAFDRIKGIFSWLKRHAALVTGVSAAALGGFGILLVLDRLAWVTTQVQRFL